MEEYQRLSKRPTFFEKVQEASKTLSPESIALLLILEEKMAFEDKGDIALLLQWTKEWSWLNNQGPRKTMILEACLHELFDQQWLMKLDTAQLSWMWLPLAVQKTSVDALLKQERSEADNQKLRELNALQKSLANSFFAEGEDMPHSYKILLEDCFLRYEMERELLYLIFQQTFLQKGKLNLPYLTKVLANLRSRNILTFAEYEKEKETYTFRQNYIRKVEQILGKTFNKKEGEYVIQWWEKWRFDLEVIEEVAKCAIYSTSRHKNLMYYHNILQKWYDLGLKTVEDVRIYQEKNKKERQDLQYKETPKNKRTSKGSPKNRGQSNVGNFKQREYQDGYLENLLSQQWSFLSEEEEAEK